MKFNALIGALLGDIAGSIYEFKPISKASDSDFDIYDERGHITDDSLLTIAMADAIVNGKDTVETLKEWSVAYDTDDNQLGFGGNYSQWIYSDKGTVNDSWGNGCLMRVSPFMWTNDLVGAIESCKGSHEHYRSALAVTKLWKLYQEPSDKDFEEINPLGFLDDSAQGTMDIIERLEPLIDVSGTTTESIIEYTVKLNGDCDTNASIIGELANYHMQDLSNNTVDYVRSKVDDEMWGVIEKFNKSLL